MYCNNKVVDVIFHGYYWNNVRLYKSNFFFESTRYIQEAEQEVT